MRERLTITPERYATVALLALAALVLIVFTGAAVRLTGSGLGCPDWPKCYGKTIAPLETHAVIEYGNRVLSGLVGLAALAAGALAWRRRPFRRDLAALGALLPVGVLGQAVLGAFTVKHHLAPGFVMAHFALSMVILVAAVALAWRARPGWEERAAVPTDRRVVWAMRGLLPVTAVTLFAGTAATAAGPHAGSSGTGERVHRLDFKGADTLDWAIHQHGRLATVLGVAAVAVWLLLRRWDAEPAVRRAATAFVALLGVQGLVGFVQYRLELPAEIVWLHVSLAALTWVAALAGVAAAGRPGPAGLPVGGEARAPA